MDWISIVILVLMIIGLIVYITQSIKESKKQEQFYYLKSVIEKHENEKMNEKLKKKIKELENENKN